MREKAGINGKPLIIWEPLPSSCTPDNLNAFCNAARSVDVLSPNHVELAGIIGKYEESLFEKDLIEELALAFLQSGVGESAQGAVVVRAGEHGCLVQSNDQPARWLPAYHHPFSAEETTSTVSSMIVDPTGAGNTFLGAFAIGFLSTRDVYQAACYGAVGASFALEQIGVPTLERSDDGKELWNGSSPFTRLQEYQSRAEAMTSDHR